jgi:4-amino-4-deoxy-L-arabinose transferase-like glycosyltransferase
VHIVILVFLCLAVFFTNLGGMALWEKDEPYYAEAAREMLESGRCLVPTFNYEIRLNPNVAYRSRHKPLALFCGKPVLELARERSGRSLLFSIPASVLVAALFLGSAIVILEMRVLGVPAGDRAVRMIPVALFLSAAMTLALFFRRRRVWIPLAFVLSAAVFYVAFEWKDSSPIEKYRPIKPIAFSIRKSADASVPVVCFPALKTLVLLRSVILSIMNSADA